MKRIIPVALLLFLDFPAFGATCKISEYTNLVVDTSGRTVPVAKEPAPVEQTVTYTTTTASAAFGAATKFIRVICDAKAHFKVASAPTATANSPYLAADSKEYFGVDAADKIAFYDGSS